MHNRVDRRQRRYGADAYQGRRPIGFDFSGTRVSEWPGMIQVTPQMRIRVAVEPADFRKGIDGLASLCRVALRSDPFSGSGFLVVPEAAVEGSVPMVAAERLSGDPGPSSPSAYGSAVRRQPGGGQRGCTLAPGRCGPVRRK